MFNLVVPIYTVVPQDRHSHNQPYWSRHQHHLSIATVLHCPSPTYTFQQDTHKSPLAHNRRPTDCWHISNVNIHSFSQSLTVQKCLLFPSPSLPRDTALQVKATACYSFYWNCKVDTYFLHVCTVHQQYQGTILLLQTDAHNYKIIGILKQLTFRLSLRHVSVHAETIIRELFRA